MTVKVVAHVSCDDDELATFVAVLHWQLDVDGADSARAAISALAAKQSVPYNEIVNILTYANNAIVYLREVAESLEDDASDGSAWALIVENWRTRAIPELQAVVALCEAALRMV